MARTFDLGLDILDRQILDKHGIPCGKVDDLELDVRTASTDGPVVTNVLSSTGAYAPRLGRIGWVFSALWKVLHPDEDPAPTPIPWRAVAKLDYAIHLSVECQRAGLTGAEDWVREHVIQRIPGA